MTTAHSDRETTEQEELSGETNETAARTAKSVGQRDGEFCVPPRKKEAMSLALDRYGCERLVYISTSLLTEGAPARAENSVIISHH